MPEVNRDQVMQEWAATNPFLTDALLFSFLNEHNGSCAFSPIQGDPVEKYYFDGTAVMHYDFALQVMFEISDATDSTNTDNMYMQRECQEWIRKQQREGNFPDLGSRCSNYELEILSDPGLAQQYEDHKAKYQFFARLRYEEEPQ